MGGSLATGKMRGARLALALVLGVALFPSVVSGRPVDPYVEPSPASDPLQFSAPQSAVTLPAFPHSGDMVELHPEFFDAGARVFLDVASLSQPAPGVVRYTVLIVTATGRGNLFYESINCEKKEWRRLAYGTRAGEFDAIVSPRWRTLEAGGSTGYHRALARYFVCIEDNRLADRAEDLRRRLAGHTARSHAPYRPPLDR